MSEEKMVYKYNTTVDIMRAVFVDFNTFFEPFFESYKKSKFTFFFQVVNLVLAFFIIKISLSSPLEKITPGLQGADRSSFQILFLLVFLIIISLLKENKILKWQTFFQMGRKLTLNFMTVLIYLSLIIYFVKEHFLSDKQYDGRNK